MYPNSRIRFRVACLRDFGKSYRMELDVAMAPDGAIYYGLCNGCDFSCENSNCYACITRVNQWSPLLNDLRQRQQVPRYFLHPEERLFLAQFRAHDRLHALMQLIVPDPRNSVHNALHGAS